MAFHKALQRHSLACVGLEFEVSPFDPCLRFVFRVSGGEVGALTAHIDDSLACGEPDILLEVRQYLGRRSGDLKVKEKALVHVGMEPSQANDFSD